MSKTDTAVLLKHYQDHIAIRQERLETILKMNHLEGLLISSGSLDRFFLDDQERAFRSNPHFTHWTACPGPGHFLHLQAGKRPRLYRHVPKSFWVEIESTNEMEMVNEFDLEVFSDQSTLFKKIKNLSHHAYIGADVDNANQLGIDNVNSPKLLAQLDWDRAIKSEYEIACIEGATKKAAIAHKKARQAFVEFGTEFEIHQAYLAGLSEVEDALPYGSIIACNEKSAILHYQKKRMVSGDVFLIDAGAKYLGYCSDITRTYVRKSVNQLFVDLIKELDLIQQRLCQQVREGVCFQDLQEHYQQLLSQVLIDSGVLRHCHADLVMQQGLFKPFFPHGLGHLLGIQVHDVGGYQENCFGKRPLVNENAKSLRLLRSLRQHEVVTVEPGLYFIPLLLNKYRHSKDSKYFNWMLVDTLIQYGGIRIEDNIVVEANGGMNVTRKYLANEYLVR